MFKSPLGALVLAYVVLMAPTAKSAEAGTGAPTPIAFMVVCQEQPVAEKFKEYIGNILNSRAGYKVVDKVPEAELIVYVNRDVNDRVNPQGMSIAIAHVSNAVSFFLASKLLVQNPTSDQTVKSALISMINQNGFLDHLSVAHIDDSSDREIKITSESVAATFLDKTPANAGR